MPEVDEVLWPVLVLTGVVVSLCVLIHYEALRLMIAMIVHRHSHRIAIVGVVFGLLTAHLLEIGVFALAQGLMHSIFGRSIGHLEGNVSGGFDAFYYSMVVYTTVGFGDITPEGPIRFMTGMEALTGLVLITWSASFTFLIMQARWGEALSKLAHRRTAVDERATDRNRKSGST
jgi:hypothetical protein